MKPCKLTAKLKRKTRKFEHLICVCALSVLCVCIFQIHLSYTSLSLIYFFSSGKLLNVLHFIYSWIENLQTLTSLSAEWEYEFLRSFPFSVLPSKLQHEMRLHSYRTSDGTFFFRKQLKSNDYDCDFNGMKTKTVKWIFMFHRRKLICAVQHDFRLKCCKQTSSSFDLFFLFRYVWCTHAFASLLMYSTMS